MVSATNVFLSKILHKIISTQSGPNKLAQLKYSNNKNKIVFGCNYPFCCKKPYYKCRKSLHAKPCLFLQTLYHVFEMKILPFYTVLEL